MNDGPVKVLLVDDDEDDFIITRDLVSQIRERPYQLNWIDNYAEGLQAVQSHQHDICLIDYRLGERTGLELLREAWQTGCRAPMILLTGQGDREIDVEAMKAGAADYLIKGQLTPDALERAMRYAIEGKRAEERLRRERDLIRRITETSPVGIVMTCRAGNITFANHKAEQVLGLTSETVLQRTGNVLKWQPTDAEGNPVCDQASPLKRVLDAGAVVEDVLMAIQTDGRRAVLSTNAAPLLDGTGNVDGIVVTVEDITERLNLEAQLRQSQKMECVGQLAAGVAHDINNVLTVIQGHAGLLLNTRPDAATQRSLKQISVATERAARFIRQLLMFSRKQVIQARVLDLNSVLRNLENMLARMLGEDVALETRYRRNLPPIEADTGMIEQIVMNLAVNSRDAMPKGGKLTIATSSVSLDAAGARQHADAREGEFVCLTVTDTGCGMDQKVLQRIFEPFFSTKEVGKGTGLGLATVYGIVKQHRGWIEVNSQPGSGTTFRVFVPALPKGSGQPPEQLATVQNAEGGRESILVVEDEAGLRELVQQVLHEYRYQVAVAASGADALRVWDEFEGRFDLLLTDMIMPGGMTGRDLANELKRRKPDLKVIYSSGYSSELVGKDVSEAGLAFLPKPYLPRQLAQVVRECLDSLRKTRSESVPA